MSAAFQLRSTSLRVKWSGQPKRDALSCSAGSLWQQTRLAGHRMVSRRRCLIDAVSASRQSGRPTSQVRGNIDDGAADDEDEEWEESLAFEDMSDEEIEAALLELDAQEAREAAAAAAAAAAQGRSGGRPADDSLAGKWEDQEWDEEELDELFERFGKTLVDSESDAAKEPATAAAVMGATASTSPSAAAQPAAEVDVPAEEFAVALACAASDTKAGDIVVLDVGRLVYWTQCFVIATAFSRPQMDALASRLRDTAEQRFGRLPTGGSRAAGSGASSGGGGSVSAWTLLDYGDVVVHLFSPRERETYRLEDFYANAEVVPLPFEQPQQQYR